MDKKIRISILGLGHVGLPTALGFAQIGWEVTGTDSDLAKLDLISEGIVPFYEPGITEMLKKYLKEGSFKVEKEQSKAIKDAECIFVCVGTPQNPDGSADLSQLETVANTIAENISEYKLIVEKSTTPVTTAASLKSSIQRYIDSKTKNHGETSFNFEFDVAVNPEFLKEGTAINDFMNPDRVVVGVDNKKSENLLKKIYLPLFESRQIFEQKFMVTDVNTAEIIKHASNAFLATKISFINMLSDLCEAADANVGDVAKGIGMDPRIGPSFLNAGIGFGGYCLPKDIRAFSWIASQYTVDFNLLKEVDKINTARVPNFIDKIKKILWVLKGKNIAVWGLSFKPNTDDIRESPAVAVVSELLNLGANIKAYDPSISDIFTKGGLPDNFESIVRNSSAIEAATDADALVILTEWNEFKEIDLLDLKEKMTSPIIFDGRNIYDSKLIRGIGFEYHGIGLR